MSKVKWLTYTVLVGLIPIICRLIVWLVTTSGTLDILAPSDFIALGLVLHISNINEVEHLVDVKSEWKTVQNGISIAFIAFYSVLFCITLVGGKIVDQQSLLYCAITLSLVSFFLSFSIYYSIKKSSLPSLMPSIGNQK